MKLACAISAILLVALCPCPASDPIAADQVTWKEHFGASRDNTNAVFCLMSQGAFRSETANVQTVVEAWLKAHPRAQVITVFEVPLLSGRPAPKSAYVWLVDGKENLNVEMVRQGCFAADTQMLKIGEKPKAPQEEYEDFRRRVLSAEQQAKSQKAGIWKNRKQ